MRWLFTLLVLFNDSDSFFLMTYIAHIPLSNTITVMHYSNLYT